MGGTLMILGIIAIAASTKVFRLVLNHKKESQLLAHQEKLAMINRGLDPTGKVHAEIEEIRAQNTRLTSRIETMETIVTSTEFELNKRLQKLIANEREESFHKLEQVSQAITSEFAANSTLSNRYKILEEIGRGGMGIVLKAQDTQLNEIVALKLITPQISADEKMATRFKQEAAASRKISHTNVIRIHDLGEFKGTLYISMEYFLGQSLKSIISRQKQLTFPEIIHYFTQICQGVNAAHQVGIIHRDLKPQNILVNEQKHLKIIDFGLAKATFLQGLTMTGLVVGTPEYMSPEQVSGKNVDHRTDLYSMGVIAYEMLTGTVPFRGETPISIGFKHLQESPSIPDQFKNAVPEWFQEIIMKMLEKDPELRYDSVQAVQHDLERQQSPTAN